MQPHVQVLSVLGGYSHAPLALSQGGFPALCTSTSGDSSERNVGNRQPLCGTLKAGGSRVLAQVAKKEGVTCTYLSNISVGPQLGKSEN